MFPSLPGGGGLGPGRRFTHRLSRHCRRLGLLASRCAPLLSGPATRWAPVLGSAALAAAAVPGAMQGDVNGDDAASATGRAQRGGSSGGASSSGRAALQFGHQRRRVTDTLLVLNCVCMMLQWLSNGLLTFWGAKINAYIMAGQLWRLITPCFLHSGLAHLAINSYALNNLGPEVELLSGGPRFLSIYLASAVAGTVASYVMTPRPSLGASGAIFGIAAALGLFYWRHQASLGQTSDRMLRQLGITAAINLSFSLFTPNIDNWGHLGGMLGGAALAWLLGPRLLRTESGRVEDLPPVRWLAYPQGQVFGLTTEGSAAARLPPPAQQQQQQQGGGPLLPERSGGSEGKGGKRGRKAPTRGQRWSDGGRGEPPTPLG